MTLLRELALYLTLLLFLLFSGSFVMNIIDARSYLQDQLESHAQDTATSLGVAIAATEPENTAAIDSMVDAVFDRGYYRLIRFIDQSGNLVVNSQHELQLEDVPQWFVNLVDLDAPLVASEVSRGWLPAGVIYIASHPGHAYRSLWNKTLYGVFLFGSGLLLAILGLNIFLRIVLRPLKKLEKAGGRYLSAILCSAGGVTENQRPPTCR
ncbi:LapD/MoxY N-terminal periplasmic domain-containing protein [Endozoicomonas lisbonensis]|uniref:LapD/MoxY N-terminal periplasmic domain-containing protein n=1 Tax=Endozoicomonas lisbonensis TaxID=3120522 RepID=UPI003396DD23